MTGDCHVPFRGSPGVKFPGGLLIGTECCRAQMLDCGLDLRFWVLGVFVSIIIPAQEVFALSWYDQYPSLWWIKAELIPDLAHLGHGKHYNAEVLWPWGSS
jgi:hypothetical protein